MGTHILIEQAEARPMNTSEAALREALAKIERLGAELQNLKNPECDPVCGQRIMGIGILLREALAARATSEPPCIDNGILRGPDGKSITGLGPIEDGFKVSEGPDFTLIYKIVQRAAASGKGSEQYKNPADETPWW